jgi:branched-subunit amino acid ABC-type transport system permease component
MINLKIITIVFTIGLLLQVYGYVNLLVSYKYEVDLMETNINTEESLSKQEKSNSLLRIRLRKAEILKQQKIIKILFWIFLIGLILTLYFLFFSTSLGSDK